MNDRIQKLVERVLGDASEETRVRVIAIVEEEVARERARCVAECRRRAELWRNTTLANAPVPAAREEARARANEAQVLADLLEQS